MICKWRIDDDKDTEEIQSENTKAPLLLFSSDLGLFPYHTVEKAQIPFFVIAHAASVSYGDGSVWHSNEQSINVTSNTITFLTERSQTASCKRGLHPVGEARFDVKDTTDLSFRRYAAVCSSKKKKKNSTFWDCTMCLHRTSESLQDIEKNK